MNMYKKIDLALFLMLAIFGLCLVAYRPWGLDPVAAASLAGALFGGAALLLGNWINRTYESRRFNNERAQRVEMLKMS